MKKQEIRHYLQILRKNKYLEKNSKGIYKVIIYKRKKEIEIPEWVFMVFKYLIWSIAITEIIINQTN